MKKTTKKLLAFLSALTLSASMVCSFSASANDQVTDSSSSIRTHLDFVRGYLIENAEKEVVIEDNLQEFLDKYLVNDDISKVFYQQEIDSLEEDIDNGRFYFPANKNIIYPSTMYVRHGNYPSFYLGVAKYEGKYCHVFLDQLKTVDSVDYNQVLELRPIDFNYNSDQRVADERLDGDINGYIVQSTKTITTLSGKTYIKEQKHDITDIMWYVLDYYYNTAIDHYFYITETDENSRRFTYKDPDLAIYPEKMYSNFKKKILSGEIELLEEIPEDLLDINEAILDQWKFDELPYDEKVEIYLNDEKYVEKNDEAKAKYITGSELPKTSPYHSGNEKVWREVLDELWTQVWEECKDKSYEEMKYFEGYTAEDIVKMVEARIQGDANEDGKTTISDAILVMQSLANPDKYQLTEQGAFNADFNGDGITALDAKKIQESLLIQ